MRALVLACVLLLCAPSALAWSSAGGPEPDTPQDATWMWPNATSQPGYVYFNAFQSPAVGVANPNTDVVGSRAQLVGPVTYHALLGTWIDCNGDGYVGLAAGALIDYPSALLPAGSPCPAGGPNNAGGWVSEMLFAGDVDPCEYSGVPTTGCPGTQTRHNPTVVYAPGARVWGDVGLPGASPLVACPTTPLPQGATSGTGALLAVVDCQDGGGIARAVPLPNVELPVSAFHNPRTGQTGLLEQGSGHEAATVWDCSARRPLASDPTGGSASSVTLHDPSGGALSGPRSTVLGPETIFDSSGRLTIALADGHGVYAYAPSPALRDPTGSWYDAANGALDGQHTPGAPGLATPAASPAPVLTADTASDCDASTPTTLDVAYQFGRVEETSSAGGAAPKSTSDWWFSFTDGVKGLSQGAGAVSPQTPTSDAGLILLRDEDHGGAMWTSQGRSSEDPHVVSRDGLGIAGARFVTFYAALPSSVGLVPHGAASYGSEACPLTGPGTPSPAHWSCDPGRWWHDASGADSMPRFTDGTARAPVVGQAFALRDVDCYDDRVANVGEC